MALVKTETFSQSFTGMSRLPLLRQFGLLIGLAAAIAVGVAVALWSQEPGYSLLYGSLNDKDAAQIAEALQRSNIPYKLDSQTGGVMVPTAKLRQARLQLASQGLPSGTGMGYEMLQKDQGFGTSRFVETARFQRAMEVELGRTVSALSNVRSARVHLAIPRPSVFLRKRDKPRASVLVNLEPGRVLEKAQVEAIVHLVSSAVPEMASSDVQVVDQKGRLLTAGADNSDLAMTSAQFEMTHELEQSYVRRIEGLLVPLVGTDGVRAEVSADMDFTVTERTQESFNPDQPAVRSEQTLDEKSQGAAGALGIPGALSNQPPGAATAPQTAAAAGAQGAGVATAAPTNSTKRVVRNYELDKTISHTRLGGAALKRLSVAVLVDDKRTVAEDGTVTTTPRTPQEIARLTSLVKEAVGFNEARGDSVSVINASFAPPPAVEPVPAPSLWEQQWVWDIAKKAGGVLLVLLIAFGVLRPMLRSLAEKGRVAPQRQLVTMSSTGEMVPVDEMGGGEAISGMAPKRLGAPRVDDYNDKMAAAQAIVKEDPKRVAQVVKAWVATDG